ncbi:MAG: glucose 1-dehydrogenase [Proteobacteria bacterium]|nr:glucose 1-dehydrogenase [Pseudomonadota bacterium]
MARLKDKVAIVTGAGGDIGAAISTRFAREGAAVVCLDINEQRVQVISDEIRRAGGRALALTGDVAQEQTAIDAVAIAQQELGGLHILVSNAVCDIPLGPLTDISAEDWRRTMDVNLNSAFLLSKHSIPVMTMGGGGNIVLVASQLGRVARPGRTWYCAQKAGLISMARAMALDHAGQNIRINSLSPGPIETGRYVERFSSIEEAQQSSATLMGRLGRADEIASAALFLSSDESSFMTGADLLIDGGYTAV